MGWFADADWPVYIAFGIDVAAMGLWWRREAKPLKLDGPLLVALFSVHSSGGAPYSLGREKTA